MTWLGGRRTVRSTKRVERRQKLFLFFSSVSLLAFLLVAGFLSWLSYRPVLQISEIIVQGNHVIADEDINAVADSVLDGKYFFFLFPRRNSLIYPEKDFEETLLDSFARIASVETSIRNFHSLVINIEEEKPFALWCREVELEESSDCYFLNENGLIFARAPHFTGNVFFRFYGDIAPKEHSIGERYLPELNEFHRINLLIETVKKMGLQVIELHLLSDTDAALVLEDGGRIIFGRNDSFSDVADNLRVVLASDTFRDKEFSVDYVDLRFGNKVYYKFK